MEVVIIKNQILKEFQKDINSFIKKNEVISISYSHCTGVKPFDYKYSPQFICDIFPNFQ